MKEYIYKINERHLCSVQRFLGGNQIRVEQHRIVGGIILVDTIRLTLDEASKLVKILETTMKFENKKPNRRKHDKRRTDKP